MAREDHPRIDKERPTKWADHPRLTPDTRRAYIRTVAAQQQVGFLDQTRATVDAAVKLNARLGEAGGGD